MSQEVMHSAARQAVMKIEDYLTPDRKIVVPDGHTVASHLDRNVAELGDTCAYRFLDYDNDGQPVELTWSQLGARIRAIGARLQQVTARGDRAAEAVPLVSCGQVSPSQSAVIVDPDTASELPDQRVGEIWLHGNNVGSGYWGRKAETELAFRNKLRARLEVGSHATGSPDDGFWFRTGDLGVYVGGELYVTGRIKDLVIIDGRNHYPQDLEATSAEASAAVRSGFVAAFSVPGEPGERLVIVAERATGAGRTDPGPVVQAIRAAIARRHAVAVADVKLVPAGAIPRTTSGKLARRACQAEYLAGRL